MHQEGFNPLIRHEMVIIIYYTLAGLGLAGRKRPPLDLTQEHKTKLFWSSGIYSDLHTNVCTSNNATRPHRQHYCTGSSLATILHASLEHSLRLNPWGNMDSTTRVLPFPSNPSLYDGTYVHVPIVP